MASNGLGIRKKTWNMGTSWLRWSTLGLSLPVLGDGNQSMHSIVTYIPIVRNSHYGTDVDKPYLGHISNCSKYTYIDFIYLGKL